MITPEEAKKIRAIARRIRQDADLFGSNFMDSPIPSWYKRLDHGVLRMVIVNKAYTEKTGISISAYFDEIDSLIWGDSQGELLSENDDLCVETRRAVRIAECLENPKTGQRQYWVGYKFPYFADNEIKGVFGEAIVWDSDVWESLSADQQSGILGGIIK